MTDSTTALRGAIADFIARHGLSPRRFGAAALGDPGFVADLARGRSPFLSTATVCWRSWRPSRRDRASGARWRRSCR